MPSSTKPSTRRCLFTAILVISAWLSGCSSSRFFSVLDNIPLFGRAAPELSQLDMLPADIEALFNHCNGLGESTYFDWVLQLQCSAALLEHEGLTATHKGYALGQYNHAIDSLMRAARSDEPLPKWLTVSADLPDGFLFVDDMQPLDTRLSPVVVGELGVPIVHRRVNTGRDIDTFYPLEGIFTSLTITFSHIERRGEQLILHLAARSTDGTATLKLAHNTYQLRNSPGAAYLALLEAANIDDYSWLGFVSADKAESRRGVFSIGTFSTDKIPLVMIHGLNSDPLIWKYLTMAVLNDEALQQRFQIWHVYYPSGPPPFYNAMRIRKRMQALLSLSGGTQLSKQGVIVGHSMGGVIAKALSVKSDYALWDATFVKRPDVLLMSENREVEDVFVFEPVFETSTVFFLDTPHRGSAVASSAIGYIGSALVSLPGTMSGIFKSFIDRVGLHTLTAKMLPFLQDYGPNSVQVLRPGHPLMEALSDIEVKGTSYSIIGSDTDTECEPTTTCLTLTDGVVDYTSAYQPKAEETLVVRSSHDSFNSPRAIEFITARLRQLETNDGQVD